jgi:hypothetical protein
MDVPVIAQDITDVSGLKGDVKVSGDDRIGSVEFVVTTWSVVIMHAWILPS